MKLKYYLRGLGLGLLMGSLIMSFSRSGPSKTDASEVASVDDTEDENQGKTLSEIADSKLKETEASLEGKDAQEEESQAAGKADDTSKDEEARTGDLEEDSETTSSEDNEDTADTEEDDKEDESKEPEENGKATEDNERPGEDVGAGLPLSERINVFSGGNDAPGTRAARGEDNSSSNTSAAAGSGSKSGTTGTSSNTATGTTSKTSSEKKPNDPFAKSEDDNKSKGQSNSGSNATVTETFTVSVYPGEGSYTVSRKLAGLGLVESAEVYDTFLCQNGYDKKIRTGNYDILKGATPEQIAKIITGNK